MVWIAAIADEVVDVLNVSFAFLSLTFFMSASYGLLTWNVKTLGEILGLSDAIIGLTSKFQNDRFSIYFLKYANDICKSLLWEILSPTW